MDADEIVTSFWHEQAIYTSTDVVQVNLAAATGDMGILANHVPTIEPLRAGVIEVLEGSGSKKWFGKSLFSPWVRPRPRTTLHHARVCLMVHSCQPAIFCSSV